MDVTVLIPVLGRPSHVQPFLVSLMSSDKGVALYPVFLVSPGDGAQERAVRNAGLHPRVVPWQARGGDYAKKMNLGFAEAKTTWVFLGADDLRFHTGWATEAIRVATQRDVCVVGTNDLGNSRTIAGSHSTHTLVHRDYGECGTIDDDSRLMHEGYDHNFVDDEFVQTAIWRATYASAPKAVVEHLHPDWGKAVTDATYTKGRARFNEDAGLYHRRCRMWGAAR